MAYLRLVSNERSKGTSRRQGSIARCGNQPRGLFLIEAAHHYRLPPKISKELSRREQGKSKRIRQIAWIAQNRLQRCTALTGS